MKKTGECRFRYLQPAWGKFACMECGHKYRTIKAAERAAFGDRGCPKCGSRDVDTVSYQVAETEMAP